LSIGEALAEARRQAGLTVSQVSQRTRIREAIITEIEADDYSACGGDFYARGHIRLIAEAIGTDPEPLIREYDTARLGPEAIGEDVTEPVAPVRLRERRGLSLTLALGLLLVAALAFAAYRFLAGSGPAAGAAHPARLRPVIHRAASHSSPALSPTRTPTPTPTPTPTQTPTAAGAIPVRPLPPVSAVAFGPSGPGQGDDPGRAQLAIDGNPASAWHTDWYTTAHFGNLYQGTGLLVNMGRPVTITDVRIRLGSAPGADLQVRAGAAPVLADLPPVASATNAGGVVSLHLARPARARYVLIWFTRLPPDPSGTFQASVSDIRVQGRP
jgi:transcriptional regulator with XRE-family HTH domain